MIHGLEHLNMNLLVALDVLLQEKSVSAAARRLGCSQPAASNRLSQLRDLFDDPLLVREGRRLVATPRADELAAPLSIALANLGRAIAGPGEFVPERADATIRIGSRFAEITFLPPLLEHLRMRAPGLDIHVRTLASGNPEAMLATGEVDLVIQAQSPERVMGLSKGDVSKLRESYYFQRLWDEAWICVVRDGHPAIGRRMTLDKFCDHRHVLISLRGDAYGFVDRALEALGRKRRVGLLVSDFMLACVTVAQTDYVLTTHPGVVDAVRKLMNVNLRVLPVPVELPTGVVSQVWHERTHRDPMQRWVRRQVFDVCGKLDAGRRQKRTPAKRN